MEIYNLIRGHFAILTSKTFRTPIHNKDFSIDNVGEWQIILNLSTGKTANVYLTDILRVYTFVVSADKDLTFAEIADYAEANCIRKGTISYVAPLLATFSDVQISKKDEIIVRFNPNTNMA